MNQRSRRTPIQSALHRTSLEALTKLKYPQVFSSGCTGKRSLEERNISAEVNPSGCSVSSRFAIAFNFILVNRTSEYHSCNSDFHDSSKSAGYICCWAYRADDNSTNRIENPKTRLAYLEIWISPGYSHVSRVSFAPHLRFESRMTTCSSYLKNPTSSDEYPDVTA